MSVAPVGPRLADVLASALAPGAGRPILALLDRADGDRAVVRTACWLAHEWGAPLTLLHVARPLHRLVRRAAGDGCRDPCGLAGMVARCVQQELHATAALLAPRGLEVELAVRFGDPAEVVAAYAATRRVGTVVTSTRPRHVLPWRTRDARLRRLGVRLVLVGARRSDAGVPPERAEHGAAGRPGAGGAFQPRDPGR